MHCITSSIYEAFLHCETKAYLLLEETIGIRSDFEEWQAAVADSYKNAGFQRLRADLKEGDFFVGTPSLDYFRSGAYRVIFEPKLRSRRYVPQLHALQRLPKGQTASTVVYAPIRFVQSQKVNAVDKLLIALDAIAVSDHIGVTPQKGKLIFGAEFTTKVVLLPKLVERAESILHRITARQHIGAPPPLVLNNHCSACRFQKRCRDVTSVDPSGHADDCGLGAGGRVFRVTRGF